MASANLFNLLGDNDNDDPSKLTAVAQSLEGGATDEGHLAAAEADRCCDQIADQCSSSRSSG